MEESEIEIDVREEIERIEEGGEQAPVWTRYLSVSTVVIAVVAAIASLASGAYSNEAVLKKNDAVLYQNKASDQWSYYQAKGIKKNIADSFYQQTGAESFKRQGVKYDAEQAGIKQQADDFEKQVEEANKASERSLEKHHRMAFAVTFFQIAIALSALSSLMRNRFYFVASLLFAVVGIGYMAIGFVM